ncbi:hypothetical protein [Cobetia marina]|jgi:hypothetical protein|uniref:hypothetical protein n=1 Tax=Cobetia marina TaxID=28258 RepID=UPI00384F96AD
MKRVFVIPAGQLYFPQRKACSMPFRQLPPRTFHQPPVLHGNLFSELVLPHRKRQVILIKFLPVSRNRHHFGAQSSPLRTSMTQSADIHARIRAANRRLTRSRVAVAMAFDGIGKPLA